MRCSNRLLQVSALVLILFVLLIWGTIAIGSLVFLIRLLNG